MDLLDTIVSLEEEAAAFGFRWETTGQIMEQIQSECVEINEHLDKGSVLANQKELQDERGDLLHAAFSLCVFCDLNPRVTLQQTLAKFERRLTAVKSIAEKKGLDNLIGCPFDELMVIWQAAKDHVG